MAWVSRTIQISSLAFIVACAPLQQAPLVYSSKTAVGLDVSTNASENPGVSINVGVKVVDAAYVPVAVSKEIDKNSADKLTIGITKLEAQYGQGNNQKNQETLTAENKEKISAYLNARAELTQAEAEVAKAEAARSDLVRTVEKIDAALTLVQATKILPTTAEQDGQVGAINGQLIADLAAIGIVVQPVGKENDGRYNFSAIEAGLVAQHKSHSQKLALAKTTAIQLASAKETKNTTAQQLLAEAAKAANLLTTSKTDAFSVYGRFDSDGNASVTGENKNPKPTAQLLVGKLFSTGLASQNLTEAVKIEANAKCVDRLVTAALAVDAATRSTLLGKIETLCPVITK